MLHSPKPRIEALVRVLSSSWNGGGIVTFRGQQYEVRILPGTILKVPTFLQGEPSSTDRCTTLTGMLRGRFQDQQRLDFDEDYFVDVHQLCDKFNRKTRSNIGYKTLLKIFACDPKFRFTGDVLQNCLSSWYVFRISFLFPDLFIQLLWFTYQVGRHVESAALRTSPWGGLVSV